MKTLLTPHRLKFSLPKTKSQHENDQIISPSRRLDMFFFVLLSLRFSCLFLRRKNTIDVQILYFFSSIEADEISD